MTSGIAHAAFNVTDMEKSVAFFERTFGFEKAFEIPHRETGKPWIVYLYAGGGQFVELFYGATKQNPYDGEKAGFLHVCLQVDDIQATWQRIVETGAPQDDPPRLGGAGNWQCWTHDPDGVKIELMQMSENSLHMQFIRSMEK